ncbi:hypothetical protein H5410_040138 [Solanum commersonii]|uniref:Uncharacterized protein n=1 Tax=Solanum commersonii TaxID=4109 RepID=A0A9J5XR78_SOLCO|nr:hypothetical protein H5410_040138 [Solanum commersonii]
MVQFHITEDMTLDRKEWMSRIKLTSAGSSSTEKLNSSPHIGFLEPGIIELQQVQEYTLLTRSNNTC